MDREIAMAALPLFKRIRDAHPKVHDFAYYLEYLTFHMPEPKLVPSLLWLIKNKLTGEKFLVFIEEECHRSGLELIRHLTMRLEREQQTRRLHAKDLAL